MRELSMTLKGPPRRFVVTRLDQPPLASAKAPADVRAICIGHGLAPIDLHDFDRSTPLSRIWGSVRSALQLVAAAPRLASAGDVVVQYPLGRINELILSRMKLGSRSVCLVHDLEMLRRPAIAPREGATLSRFDVVVAHSEAMADVVQATQPDRSVIVLEAFDFLGTRPTLPAAARPNCLYIFGNLSTEKAGYLYKLDTRHTSLAVEAYGPHCDVERLPQGVRWNGVLDPDDPSLGEIRGFGLVWDGDSPSALAGPVGEYLKYNAPHKFSLYLALGIPVIVPSAAAIAPVVERYALGVCVSSVEEGLRVVETCSESSWEQLVQSARDGQRRVRSGEFLRSALLRAGVADDRAVGRQGRA
jgi:hypothetical protein